MNLSENTGNKTMNIPFSLSHKRSFLMLVSALSLSVSQASAIEDEQQVSDPIGISIQQATKTIDSNRSIPPEKKEAMKEAAVKAIQNPTVQKMIKQRSNFAEEAQKQIPEELVEDEKRHTPRLGHAILFLEFGNPFCLETMYFMNQISSVEGLSPHLSMKKPTPEEIELLKAGKIGNEGSKDVGFENHLGKEKVQWLLDNMSVGIPQSKKYTEINTSPEVYGITQYPSVVYIDPEGEVLKYQFKEHEGNQVFKQFFKPIEEWQDKTKRKAAKEKLREKYYGEN